MSAARKRKDNRVWLSDDAFKIMCEADARFKRGVDKFPTVHGDACPTCNNRFWFQRENDFLCTQCGTMELKKMNYRQEVMRNCPNFSNDTIEKKLSLAGLGVAGEAGEVADLIKKILHHDVALPAVREKLIKEMGDVYWYLEYLCAAIDTTQEEVQITNVQKLHARHPNGWSPESQQAKADEK